MNKPHQLLSILTMCAAITSLPAAAEAGPPLQLKMGVGGFHGPSHTIELHDKTLRCTEVRAGKTVGEQIVTPTAAQWQALRENLDSVNVWAWQKHYFNMEIRDGLQWYVAIKYADRSVVSEGSNSFPDDKGVANNAPQQTAAFERFRASMSSLFGQCHF